MKLVVKSPIIKAKEKVELSLIDLHKALDETPSQKVISTVRAFLDLKDSSALNLLLPLLGAAGANILEVPVAFGALAGLGLNAVMAVANKKTPKIDNLSSELRDFAYLYEIEKLSKKSSKLDLQRFNAINALIAGAAKVSLPQKKKRRVPRGNRKIESIICNNCNFEVAAVYEKEDGKKELICPRELALQTVDKEKNLFSVTCPNCNNVMPTDLVFWARF